MVYNYKLDAEDEKIINELDNLCGVIQNKPVLKDIITYTKLRRNNEINFGNYNIIVRNNSSYNLLTDFLKICSKIFMKYHIIENDNICFLDRITNNRRDFPLDKISGINDGIIVINERKLRINYTDELDDIAKIVNNFKNKVFIFEDTSYCEGDIDAKLDDLASWRMTIEKISLDDKIMYCMTKLDNNTLKYKKQDLKSFADVPFWTLKNSIMKVIIECKSKGLDYVDKQILIQNKSNTAQKNVRRNTITKKSEKSAKEELNELIGLNDIKSEVDKILNYVKLNKERGNMPSLHMCFTGNPGTGKTSIARIIGKLFQEEKILSGSGEFVEIHGRDLVAKYVGWTAQKVHETVESAIGNVLFIDEAYSLVNENYRGGFEDEAIATLIKEMEDHRNEICIIIAGYTEEMQKLIRINPGFESRIQFTIDFPDYNEFELLEIFEGLCKKEHYKISDSCKGVLLNNFSVAKSKEAFGNGRYVRNLFEKIKFEQADRIVRSNCKFLDTIRKEDIVNVVQSLSLDSRGNAVKLRKIGFGS